MDNEAAYSWQYLVTQYLNNRISKSELEILLQKVAADEQPELLTAALEEQWKAAAAAVPADRDWDTKFTAMMAAVPEMPVRKGIQQPFKWLAAAIILLLVSAGSYIFFIKKTAPQPVAQVAVQPYDLAPGTVGGILTLANGEQIRLDSAGNGLLAVQGTTRVTNRQGHITYNTTGKHHEQSLYNTITTPRSKLFQLILDDGSRIWLNAASAVRYPITFSGADRKVYLTGEAYFEIAPLYRHGKRIPFTVHANGMDIKVLGTHFNVNAYTDEKQITTTLLEGSVAVSGGGTAALLRPGEQAQLQPSQHLTIHQDIDTESVMAWKNGYFSFDQTDLPAVMRQIARWYDVDIVYEGRIPNRRFGGEISRNNPVSQVLKILEESKIHFRIEEKRIVVLP
ncbi:FecR family protein [Chitinophaga nivalis]|uniref:DUF4974 domain-containing protein n=1 Tax=Chitinophaga nivalis TaxID=2991709 RepID=A0ABT3ISJ8_9BACT|nr:FecR family protein [Chitinophaga nivalis]MCW3463434.1 DUF4974 domain-containing protein [Chitinophaga nivalis]MCW3486876.1 DUF4974 domain-containing protein [Chitinophaga nivalis]